MGIAKCFFLLLEEGKNHLCLLVKAFPTTDLLFLFILIKFGAITGRKRDGQRILAMVFLELEFFTSTLRYKFPTPENEIIGKISQRS